MNRLLVLGNMTMPGVVGIFNLPPILTCTPSKWCTRNCYALRGRFIWRNIKARLNWRYEQSLMNDFSERMMDEISHSPSIKYIRIHISGDFYSKEYINKWAIVAEKFPNIIFRTNTRRVKFLQYMKDVLPKNIVIRESTDPSRKCHMIFPQAAIKGTPGSGEFFVCRDNCDTCGFHCWYNPQINVVTSKVR